MGFPTIYKYHRNLAFHEAGHAIVSLILDMAFDVATIDKTTIIDISRFIYDDDRLSFSCGFVADIKGKMMFNDLTHHKDLYLRIIVIQYASKISVEKAGLNYDESGFKGDNKVIDNCINKITQNKAEQDKLLPQCKRGAEIIINEYWYGVKLLAETLLKEKTLSYGQCKKLCHKPRPAPGARRFKYKKDTTPVEDWIKSL